MSAEEELKRIGDKVSLAVACDNPSVEALVDQLIYNYDQIRKGPVCAYCGTWEPDITDHIMVCPQRPEMKLIMILGSFAQVADQCLSNYAAQDVHQLRSQVKYFLEKTHGQQFLETAKSWIDRALKAEAELAALKTMTSAGPEDCDKANQ